jgi:hypothetical protein
MPVGSVIIGFEAPKNPPESTITENTFQKLVHNRINRRLREWNIEPARFHWIDQPATPDDSTDAPEYLRTCFQQAGIDAHAIEPELIGDMFYCLEGTCLVCYSRFALNWTNPESSNPFRVQIPLGNGKAVSVALSCMLSFNQYGAA